MGCGSWGIRWGGEPPRVASGPSPNVAFVRPRFMGIGEKDSMQHTVVRCAEGHVFSTASFPMQNLGRGRLGPGRLLRCPRCARLRHSVPVGQGKR